MAPSDGHQSQNRGIRATDDQEHLKAMKLAIVIAVMLITGCQGNRTQAQRDADHAQFVIMHQRRSPSEPLPRIITTHRSKTHPDVICGYWDEMYVEVPAGYINEEVPAGYMPFAINDKDNEGAIYSLRINGQLPSVNEMSSQYEAIKIFCGGEPLPYPGYKKGHRPW